MFILTILKESDEEGMGSIPASDKKSFSSP